jgi:hypothetical protein
MQEFFFVNSSRFPHETIDNETILFDAETGHVILLAGLASVLWTHLVTGAELGELCEAVNLRFGADASAITRVFLDDLCAAEILVPTNEKVGADSAPSPWPSEFTAPSLERYDDIAKIIAMDPIHEVDPTGWPRSARDSET